MNFDQILAAIGGFGKYQKILYIWICLPQILLAFHMMASVFTGATPPHHCQEGSSSGIRNQTFIPGSVTGNASLLDVSCFFLENQTERVPCVQGWVYSQEVFQSTTVTEWDLVCTKAGFNSLGSSIYMFGLLVGSVVFGAMADRYGTEWTCTKRRMLAGIITDYTFGLGYMLLAGVAYLIRDWRKLQLAISAPGFLLIFYIWVLPQSARWLLASDRREEAVALLRKAALVNGRVLPPAFQVEKWEMLGGAKRNHSVLDLVQTPQMRKRSVILFYIWFVNVLVYYGLSLGVSRLGTNLYLTQFVFGLVEIPARTLVLFVLPLSRRLSQSGFLAVGGLACLLMLTIPADHPNILTGLAMVGKFGITASFAVIYVYTAEIFPTVVRQTGIGVSSMFARMGGVLAPMINMLHNHSPATPLILFGVSPLLGAMLALALPETADRPLPDTLEDAENWDDSLASIKGNIQLCENFDPTANSTEKQDLKQLAN
uniref:Major facilitator superfamily (MFS) profile domain-containing protein n=1 Tax=Nothobranchius korthausae TaxID=1143690 RepID=A0A1A8H2S3_9TELE